MEENNNMASSSLAQTIKSNFLKCSICLNPFRDPRTLPCHHGFCRECLEKCVASGTNRKRKTLACPSCRKEVKISKDGVKDLPVHFIVNSLKDTVDIEEKAQIPSAETICSNCDAGSRAKVRCVDCKEYMCDSCYTSHATIKLLKDHKVISMVDILAGKVNLQQEEENRYCNIHGKLSEYFCETEQKAVCRDCVILDKCPTQHTRVSLKEAAQNLSEDLKELVTQSGDTLKRFQEAVKTNANVMTELDIYSQLALDTLEMVEREYIDLVIKTVQDFKGKVDKIKQDRIKVLEKKQRKLESCVKDIENATEHITRIIQTGSEFEVISSHAALSSQLKKLSKSKPGAVDKSLGFMKFEAATPAISPIGQLLKKGTQALGEGWKQVGLFNSGDFDRLHGLDINRESDIVACCWDKGVKVFSRAGQVMYTLHESSGAADVAVTPNNGYMINTLEDKQIKIADGTGTQISTIPLASDSNSVAVDHNGKIIVGQVLNTISIHNANGSLISEFATQSRPYRLAVTSNGDIVSSFLDDADESGDSVQLMDYSGNNVRVIQPPPDIKVWQPGFVCCRPGEIFVSNEGYGDPKGVYRFTAEGNYLGCVTTQVGNPTGLAMARDGMELFVADLSDNHVKIFKRP